MVGGAPCSQRPDLLFRRIYLARAGLFSLGVEGESFVRDKVENGSRRFHLHSLRWVRLLLNGERDEAVGLLVFERRRPKEENQILVEMRRSSPITVSISSTIGGTGRTRLPFTVTRTVSIFDFKLSTACVRYLFDSLRTASYCFRSMFAGVCFSSNLRDREQPWTSLSFPHSKAHGWVICRGQRKACMNLWFHYGN